MTKRGAVIAAAATRLIGVPYTLHGRHPVYGLDCAGLVVLALEAANIRLSTLPDYGLRNFRIGSLLSIARSAGFEPAKGFTMPGDIVATNPGPAQLHLLIAVEDGNFIHAHAGLRRVVRMPGPLPWPALHHLRLIEKD